MNDDEHNLTHIAESVADRRSVDWQHEIDSNPRIEARLNQLRLIESIGNVYRSPEPEPRDDTPKTWGKLRLIEKLGEGSYGEVFRAYDPTLEREVALKLLHASRAQDESAAHRFLDEARRLAKVRHSNVLMVHGADRYDGRVGLWADLLEGRTLEQCLAQDGPFGAHEATRIGIDLCRALAAVHSAGLVHRDIKTANVMRERGGRIVLLDFSSVAESRPDHSTTRISGTPLYMAPELLEGNEPSPASDVYSLGVVLYRLVSGRLPIECGSFSDLVEQHRQHRAIPLRDVRPDLPGPFVQAVEKALDPDPRSRLSGAAQFERALAASIGQVPAPAGEEKKTRGWKKPIALGAMAAALILAVALAVVAVTQPWARPMEVQATMYRLEEAAEERLLPGSTIVPGDRLFLEIEGSVPCHIYIINQDQYGKTFVLFPLEGLDLQNPLPSDTLHRLPGSSKGVKQYWQVTSAGGREDFVMIASREPLAELELSIEAIPRAASSTAVELDRGAVELLRGIGGLVPDDDPPFEPSDLDGLEELSEQAAREGGIWIQHIRLNSEARRVDP